MSATQFMSLEEAIISTSESKDIQDEYREMKSFRTIQIYQALRIIDDVKFSGSVQEGWFVKFHHFPKKSLEKFYKYRIEYFSTRQTWLENCFSSIVRTVQTYSPDDACLVAKRILDGTACLKDDNKSIEFAGDRLNLKFPTSVTIDSWLPFYRELRFFTGDSAENERKLQILRDLGILRTSERESHSYRGVTVKSMIFRDVTSTDTKHTYTVIEDFVSHYGPTEYLNRCECYENILRYALSRLSTKALRVVNLAFDGLITEAKLVKNVDYPGGFLQHIEFYIDGKKFVTGFISHKSGEKFYFGELYDSVLAQFDDFEVGKNKAVPAIPIVADRVVGGVRSARPNDGAKKLAHLQFGRSQTDEGIREIIETDEWTSPACLRMTDDGYWYEDDHNRKSLITKRVLDASTDNLGNNPWIIATFRFATMYNPTKKYIILADCDEDDLSHPAVTFYNELKNKYSSSCC